MPFKTITPFFVAALTFGFSLGAMAGQTVTVTIHKAMTLTKKDGTGEPNGYYNSFPIDGYPECGISFESKSPITLKEGYQFTGELSSDDKEEHEDELNGDLIHTVGTGFRVRSADGSITVGAGCDHRGVLFVGMHVPSLEKLFKIAEPNLSVSR